MKITRRHFIETGSVTIAAAMSGCGGEVSPASDGHAAAPGKAAAVAATGQLQIGFSGLCMYLPGNVSGDDTLTVALVDARYNIALGLDEHIPTLAVPRDCLKDFTPPDAVTSTLALWRLDGEITLTNVKPASAKKLDINTNPIKKIKSSDPQKDNCPDIKADKKNWNTVGWIGKLSYLHKGLTLSPDWANRTRARILLKEGFVEPYDELHVGETIRTDVYKFDPPPEDAPATHVSMSLKETVTYRASFDDSATIVMGAKHVTVKKPTTPSGRVTCVVTNLPAMSMGRVTRVEHFKAYYELYSNPPAIDKRSIPVVEHTCDSIDESTACPGGQP